MTRSLAPAAFALCLGLGCAGAPGLPPVEVPAPTAAQVARMRELAADLHARASAARALSLDSPSREAAREHAERARLLYEAAELEADRIELASRTDAALRTAAVHARARAAAVHARLALEREQRLREAVASYQALSASAAPAPRGTAAEQARTRAHRQRALAHALLAAAQALQAPVEAVRQADHALLSAELEADSAIAAERALAGAERALGAARARRPAPDPDELASLAELAQTRGLTVRALPTGALLELPGAFATGSGRLTPTGRTQLAAALGVLRAHPHGPVQLLAGNPRARLALERGLAEEPQLRDRIEPSPPEPPGPPLGRGDAALRLPAYGLPAADGPAPAQPTNAPPLPGAAPAD